jgi:ABC-type branched-subunit amino acid transport system substrate-binding protein
MPGTMRDRWGRLERRWRILLGTVAVALVATVGTVLVTHLLTHCPGSLRYEGQQCVGVSDNNDVFDPGLADVLGKFRAENQRIAQLGKPVVSVGVLVSMPKPGDNVGLAGSTREQLEGVYLAQLRANSTATLGSTPLLRLLVANAGENTTQWQYVVPNLIERAQRVGDNRLVAVVASGDSVQPMLDALNQLFQAEIPVVPIRLTASRLSDDVGNANIPLARPTPTNQDQVDAMVTALRATSQHALLLADTNPNDFYTTSLADAFTRAYPDATHTLVPTETYDSTLGGVANTMHEVVQNICQTQPDLIYFAGRSADLESFVEALANRSCPDQHIRLASGSDAVIFAGDVASDPSGELHIGLRANSEVIFTALAHPDAWVSRPDAFSTGAIAPLQLQCSGSDCFYQIFPHESLTDGSVIMGYDALLVAVRAIRPGGGLNGAPLTINDNPLRVAQELRRIHGIGAVAGASGWISLNNSGNPRKKAMPILKMQPDGTVVFNQLAAPQGTPCEPNLHPPNC